MTNNRLFAGILLTALLGVSCFSQTFTYEIEPSGTKVLKGFFERKNLEDDTLFAWFANNYNSYRLDSASIEEMKAQTEDLHFVMVVGTWCGDSKREIPKQFKILDALGISEEKIIIFGVDRSKRSQDGTTEKYNVMRVPTLIVFRGDEELGRIVESPRHTQEKDLLRLLSR